MNDVLSALEGLGPGFTFRECYNKKKEIEQGSNPYLAAPCLAGEVAAVGMVVSRLADNVFQSGVVKGIIGFLCTAVPIITIPFSLFFAAVKSNDYAAERKNAEDLMGGLSSFGLKIVQLFPEELSDTQKKVFGAIADHIDDILLVAMIAGTVALLAIGEFAFAIAGLSVLGYNMIDRAGWVPRKISLFVESYLPGLALVGNIIGGTLIIRVLSVVALTGFITPLKWFIFEKIDGFARDKLGINSPSLGECNAAWEDTKELSNDDIWNAINAPWYNLDIDPAHCTKSIVDESSLPTDEDCSQFLTLFDTVDWTKEYNVMKRMMIDDDKFQEYIIKTIPKLAEIVKQEDRNKEIQLHFDDYMLDLAKQEFNEEEFQTKEKYAAKWVRDQMVEFDKVVTEKKRVEGAQSDLNDALESLSKILPDLKARKDAQDITFKDNLLKIAIEGGDYCARGIKRMAHEMVVALCYKLPVNELDSTNQDDFEMQIKQMLLDKRVNCVHNTYNEYLVPVLPKTITKDIHGYDIYRLMLSAGFLPLTKSDKFNFGLGELMISIQYEVTFKYGLGNSGLRNELFTDYKHSLRDVAKEVGMLHVCNYVLKKINENKQLTEEQKEKLFVFMDGQGMVLDDYNKKVQQLMFVMLGILKLPTLDEEDSE